MKKNQSIKEQDYVRFKHFRDHASTVRSNTYWDTNYLRSRDMEWKFNFHQADT